MINIAQPLVIRMYVCVQKKVWQLLSLVRRYLHFYHAQINTIDATNRPLIPVTSTNHFWRNIQMEKILMEPNSSRMNRWHFISFVDKEISWNEINIYSTKLASNKSQRQSVTRNGNLCFKTGESLCILNLYYKKKCLPSHVIYGWITLTPKSTWK